MIAPLRAARRAALALAAAAAVLTGGARTAAAQGAGGTVVVVPPAGGDTLRSVTPTFLVQAVNFGRALPLRFQFQIASNAQFVGPLLVDTLLTVQDSVVTVAPAIALPSQGRVWWRATVLDPAGVARTSPVGGPRIVPPWVTTITPPNALGVPLTTRRPRFVWRSPAVNDPPGPWEYTLTITNLGNRVITVGPLRDTSYTPGDSLLQANASYSWQVTARLRGSPDLVAVHPYTFVIEDSTVGIATLFYQNFPNPFPTALAASTCFWFDLASPSRVTLDVFTLRGIRVRRILPVPGEPERFFNPGRYGRASGGGPSCDPRYAWDGRDDGGHDVPAGLYLVRFHADGVETVKKILFRGR